MKYFKCSCEHCGGRIEYPAQSVGLSCQCPHCGKETDLTLPAPPEMPSATRKHFMWLIVAAVILLLGGIGIAVAFVMLNRMARRRPPA